MTSEEWEELEKGCGLNARQANFCLEYMIDSNATQAYIRAGYEEEGAAQSASRLLTNDKVQKAIKKLKADKARTLLISKESILAQIDRIANSDIRQIYHPDGGLLGVPQLPDDVAAAVVSVKVAERKVPGTGGSEDNPPMFEEVTEYKLADKLKGLELLGKNLELWVDKSKMDVTVVDEERMLERMAEARQRVSTGGAEVKPIGNAQGPKLAEPLNAESGDMDDQPIEP